MASLVMIIAALEFDPCAIITQGQIGQPVPGREGNPLNRANYVIIMTCGDRDAYLCVFFGTEVSHGSQMKEAKSNFMTALSGITLIGSVLK